MPRYRLLLLLGILAPAPVVAQATPEAAAEAFGAAIVKNDWAGAARLMHPQALRQLRDIFVPLLSSPEGGEVGTQLFGVTSGAQLAATPDTALFARFLEKVTTQAGLGDALKGATITPLGHVTLPGDTALVVSRMTMTAEGLTLSVFDVMPFIKHEGVYRGMLKADFTNMSAMLKARLGGRS